MRVLLVDDNAATVKLASYVFEQAGWTVKGFTSPRDALEALEEFEPDLIVTDFQMPEMNAPEFLLAAEQKRPCTPNLVMTAFDDDPDIQEILRKAAIPSVSKTQGLSQIVEISNDLISIRKAVKARHLMVGA